MEMIGWDRLEEGARAALEQAFAGWQARGLPCGASIVDGHTVIARGRNHAYDAITGSDPLEGTPLAHAEMNALARVSTESDLTSATLWSTQQPCAMCAAAIEFCEVGATRYLAADPAFVASDDPRAGAVADPTIEYPELSIWAVLANAMFLQPAFFAGATGNLERSRGPEPEMAAAAELLARADPTDLAALVRSTGDRLGDLAMTRLARLGRA